MDPRHLELLHQLDQRGSVTAVAAATYRTPSAVSQQLRQATKAFGRDLVEPSGRGIRLTEAGRLLARGGKDVAETLARVQADWDDYLGEPTGTVRIAGLPSALTFLIPPTLRDLRENDPGIEVHAADVDLAEHEFAALTKDVDIVVAHSLTSARPKGTRGLIVESLARERIDVAMALTHPLAGRRSVRPADVVDFDWIGVPPDFPFSTILDRIEAATGARLRVGQRIRDNRLIEAIVASSDQLALLPRRTTPTDSDEAAGTGLRLTPLVDVETSRWVVAVMRRDTAERAAVKRVLRALARAGRDEQAPG